MKALLIAYHFPPSLGGSPMRTGAFAQSLVERGWECHAIVARIPANHPVYRLDCGISKNSNKLLEVYIISEGILGRTAQQFRRLQDANSNGHSGTGKSTSSGSLRATLLKPLAFPDPKIGWIPGAIRQARYLMRNHRFDLIYSFGYPWSCHVVAHAIRKGTGIPWIADYGDPWTFNPETSHHPWWRRKLDFLVESKLLRNAAAVVVSTPETRTGFLSIFGDELSPRMYVAPVAQFYSTEYDVIPSVLPRHFQISFTGMYDSTRQPYSFYDAAKVFHQRSDLRICVAGIIGKKYEEYVRALGLDSIVCHVGRLHRKETVHLQRNSHVLLSFGWPGGVQVPCKVYEYFAARRPILHIAGDAQDPAANLVRKYRRGLVVPNDPGAIGEGLRALHELWTAGRLEDQFELSRLGEFCLPRSLDGLKQAVDAVFPSGRHMGATSVSELVPAPAQS
jgi:glycosyltransferase involved in cell wall biosynthesis